MYTLFLMFVKKFSFSTAGGGVRGTDAGIGPGTMIPAGDTIRGFQPFIQKFPPTGGTTIETTVGKDIIGTTSEYPKTSCKIIGRAGRGINTGRNNTPGV
jgi:hypothetical protein